MQVEESQMCLNNVAAAVGEHQEDVEYAIRSLVEKVGSKHHSMSAMVTAIQFMTAARAVLEAGAKSVQEHCECGPDPMADVPW